MGASLCFVFHRATTDSQPRDYSDNLLPKIAPPLIHLSNKQYFCIVFAVNPDGQPTVNYYVYIGKRNRKNGSFCCFLCSL